MALSEHEQRLLDEMERSLYQGDADFMAAASPQRAPMSARALTIAVIAIAAGIGVVIVGLAIGQPLVGLLGFLVIVAGLAWAFSGKSSAAATETGPDAASDPKPSAAGGQSRNNSEFMSRLEERWDERRRGDL